MAMWRRFKEDPEVAMAHQLVKITRSVVSITTCFPFALFFVCLFVCFCCFNDSNIEFSELPRNYDTSILTSPVVFCGNSHTSTCACEHGLLW